MDDAGVRHFTLTARAGTSEIRMHVPARCDGDHDTTEGLDLPKTYGLDDIPLIIQNRR